MRPVLRHLIRALAGEPCALLPDSQLLELYRSRQDEQAFAALIARHGPLVLGVCRRTLAHAQDAEDAFQATFLVLARKAGSIREGSSVASWLHGVAARLALAARRASVRRQQHEREAAERAIATGEASCSESLRALDEELQRLPESLRAPLLLCYLAGRTQRQAACQLGWSFGTFRRRLEQGRDRLRDRLVRRGLAPALLLAATPIAASFVMPTALAAATLRTVLGGAVSPTVITLAEKGLQTMLLTRTKLGIALALAVGLAIGVVGHQTLTAQSPPGPSTTDPNASNNLRNRYGVRPADRTAPDIDQRLADLEKRLEGALGEVKALRQALKTPTADTLVFKLKVTSAARAAEVVRAAFPGGQVRITPDDQTNSLLVQAGAADTEAIRRLLEALDSRKAGEDPKPSPAAK